MAKKRIKLGNIYEINLPNGKNAYARLYEEYTLGIYNGFYNSFEELSDNESIYRFISVYKDLLQDNVWKIVGYKPFANNEDAWSPPQCVVNSITLKGSLYVKGKIIPCSYDECKNLEIVAVWDRHHVVDMLMGSTVWDDAINKPINI